MKLKSKTVSFYMWQCLLITIEIHQTNSETETTQPPLVSYEKESDIQGATSEILSWNSNKNEAVSTDSIPEGMSFM